MILQLQERLLEERIGDAGDQNGEQKHQCGPEIGQHSFGDMKGSLIALERNLEDEMKDQRKKVTELAIALHKKINSSGNPAESADRSEKRVNR